jgi:hypothetical protein
MFGMQNVFLKLIKSDYLPSLTLPSTKRDVCGKHY